MPQKILKKPLKPKDPPQERMAVQILFGLFIALLAGRFSLGRLSSSLPALDLRLVFVYVLTIWILVWVTLFHRVIPKRTGVPGGLLFLLWAGWLALSGLWSPPEARVLPAVLDIFLMVILVVIAWTVLMALPPETTARVWKWLLIAGVIYFVLAIADGPGDQGRYAAPGGGPNVFVRVMVLASLAALYVTLTKNKIWPLTLVPVFAVGAALSGSRGGILSAGIVLALFAIPVAIRLGFKRLAAIGIAGSAAVYGVANWNDGQVAKFVEERYIQQTLVEGYSSGRDTIAETAVAIYEAHPVMGLGIDGYYAVMPQFEYAHNLFLSTAAETGTVGVVLLSLALLRFTLLVRRPRRPISLTVIMAVAAGIYLTLTSLWSGDYYDSRFMWFFFGWAAIESTRRLREQGASTASVAATQNHAANKTRQAQKIIRPVIPSRH